ncbi:MAG: S41 family peptidase [Lachnospiraceae bacterium]|nr:S41 family peptidase [Lachnospiraceae bacterium]
MEEKKNQGFWKGFWIGFALFMFCSTALISVILWRSMEGLDAWKARQETAKPTEEKPTEIHVVDPETEPGDEPSQARNDEAERLEEVIRYIDTYFVLDYDKDEMINAALKAYVAAAEDPYSQYLTAEEFDAMMEESSGSYCGVGVQIQQKTETMVTTVLQVFSNGSAKEAGVKPGDIIIGINGENATMMTVDEIVSLVRGEEGTTVEVTFWREWEEMEYSVTLTRRPVEVDTVYYEMKTDGIGYLQLTEFDDVSVKQMETALKALKKEGCSKLILDLRNNPGGLLSSVLDIADLFMKKGLLIFSMEDKQGNVYTYSSEKKATFDGDVIVLVNSYSASASEVLTGCLKDHKLALIMGQKTFGKGIVQGFFKLSDGSAIKLTTEHYQTPGGHDIHKIGIEPDVEGFDDPTTEDVDELIEQAIDYFKQH